MATSDTPPDPYGIDLAIDVTGDVIVTPSGAIGTIDGPQNCVQALVARMLTRPGELTQHPEYGSTFQELIGTKYSLQVIQSAAANEVRTLVGDDPRFLAGTDITAEAVDGAQTAARVSLALQLSGGDQLTVSDLAGPGVEVTATPQIEDLSELSDFEAELAADDWDFFAQDDAELAELADADLSNTFVLPDTTEGDF